MRYGMWALGLAVVVGGLSSGGCATIVNGSTQQVNFQSSPDGATVTIVQPGQRAGLVLGKTPLTVQMQRSEAPQAVVFSKDGHASLEMPVETTMSGWFFGNVLFGGFIGSTTDAASGAAVKYSPDRFFAVLNPLHTTAIERNAVVAYTDRVRLFILQRHAGLLSDLSRGRGEDLDALLSLLYVTEPDRLATSDRLRTLARTYPDPLVFADHVLHLEIAAK